MPLPGQETGNVSNSGYGQTYNTPYSNNNMWQAAAIQAGSGLLGSFVNWGMAAQQNKKQRKWSEEMWNKQNEYNYSMWQEMNEYNSPGAQMQRLKEAGLNPNLMYTQGNVGNTGSYPQADNLASQDVFGLPPMTMPEIVTLWQDIRTKEANIDQIRSMTESVKADTAIKEIQAALGGLDLKQKPIMHAYDIRAGKLSLKRQSHEIQTIIENNKWLKDKWDMWIKSGRMVNIDEPVKNRILGGLGGLVIDAYKQFLEGITKPKNERGPGPIQWNENENVDQDFIKWD